MDRVWKCYRTDVHRITDICSLETRFNEFLVLGKCNQASLSHCLGPKIMVRRDSPVLQK